MLTVLMMTDLHERQRYQVVKSSGMGVSRCIAIQSYRPERIPWSRMRSEYLKQGKNFDKFKNREVENFQNEGNLVPIPSDEDIDRSHQSNYRIWDHNPNIKIGSDWYSIVNLLPVVEMLAAGRREKKYNLHQINIRSLYPGTRFDSLTLTLISVKIYDDFTEVEARVSLSGGSFVQSEYQTAVSNDMSRWFASRISLHRDQDLDISANVAFDSIVELVHEFYPYLVNRLRRSELFGELKLTQMSSRRTFSISAPDLAPCLDAFYEYSQYVSGFAAGIDLFSDEEKSLLGKRVVEKINDFSSNLIAYFSEFSEMGGTIRELLALPRNLKNPKKWASAWLSYRFGDRLAVQDTKELLEAIERKFSVRQSMAIGRSSYSKIFPDVQFYKAKLDVHQETTATLIVANDSYNGIMTAIKKLMTWDAWPTLENSWDMIPLSFVVDWILPISDILSDLDTWIEKAYLKPLSSYIGRKVTLFPKDDVPWVGDAHFKCYVRKRHEILNDILPFTLHDITPAFSITHLVDTIALGRQFKR